MNRWAESVRPQPPRHCRSREYSKERPPEGIVQTDARRRAERAGEQIEARDLIRHPRVDARQARRKRVAGLEAWTAKVRELAFDLAVAPSLDMPADLLVEP